MMNLKHAAVAVAATATFCAGAANAQAKYTFYHVLWGMTDANVQFHIRSGEAYMASHPDVEIKYVGPENYDPAEHAKFLDTVVNAEPDGIAMHISSVDAMLPGLRAAAEKGIPFVSTTSHPPLAADNERLEGLYLNWVGANEMIVGAVMAEHVLKSVTPRRVAYLMSHLGHAGQEQRADGFFAEMPDGVAADKVATGEEPLKGMDVIRSYVQANPDIDIIFGSALTHKWTADVLEELGREDVLILTSDEAPTSLECILAGKCFASFGQQLPIQAPFAYDLLYQYNETGMTPVVPIITGPAIIDMSNVESIKETVVGVLGEDAYYGMSPF